MKVSFVSQLSKAESSDLVVVPFWEGPRSASDLGPLQKKLQPILGTKDFKGKSGESALFYSDEGERILLIGLGEEGKGSVEILRRAFASSVKAAFGKKVKTAAFLSPTSKRLGSEGCLRGALEGVLLTNYAFDREKGDTLKDAAPLLEKIVWVGEGSETLLKEIRALADGVCFARDLVNGNADEITPQALADAALALKGAGLKAKVYDKKWLKAQKMGLILAVNRAASLDPFLIEVSYQGNPKSKDHVVLVGKGVTYDTGGLALKTPDGMCAMKCDMAGAAAALGAVQCAAQLKLKVNVTALVPTVENAIGPLSYKMGDVYRSYSGRTVEINNTDAEGRLILADALSYAAQNLHPTCMIDLATLTGAMIIALGDDIAGLFASDDALSEELIAASKETAELLWRMPLPTEYKELLKSDIADTLNSGGRTAGSITAALFLQEFTAGVPWAHLDIAGPAFWSKPKYYHPTKATGFGVRLLVEFLKRRAG